MMITLTRSEGAGAITAEELAMTFATTAAIEIAVSTLQVALPLYPESVRNSLIDQAEISVSHLISLAAELRKTLLQ